MMRRATIGAAALLLLLTTCTATITVDTHWSASWEKTCTIAVSYEDGELESILVDVNGSILPPLARGAISARATVHLLDLPGLYIAVATEAEGLLWEAIADYEASVDERLLLTITSLTVTPGPPDVSYGVERSSS